MSHYPFQTNNCTLYPGEYIPMHHAKEIPTGLTRPVVGSDLQSSINVSELSHYFKVEAAIPGLSREDFIVDIDDDLLTISVLHKVSRKGEDKKYSLHEFDYEYFTRIISLPENTEKEFVNAEYKNGILSVYLPKTNVTSRHPHTSVIVY